MQLTRLQSVDCVLLLLLVSGLQVEVWLEGGVWMMLMPYEAGN